MIESAYQRCAPTHFMDDIGFGDIVSKYRLPERNDRSTLSVRATDVLGLGVGGRRSDFSVFVGAILKMS